MKESPKTWRTLLNRWISGEANHRDERSLGGMAGDDPFLADAWEGYRSLPEEDHARSVTKLKADLRKRYIKKRKGASFYLIRIAAIGAVLVAAWWLFRPFGPLADQQAMQFDERTESASQKNTPEDVVPSTKEHFGADEMASEENENDEQRTLANEEPNFKVVSPPTEKTGPPAVQPESSPQAPIADKLRTNKKAGESSSGSVVKKDVEKMPDGLADATAADGKLEKEAAKRIETEADLKRKETPKTPNNYVDAEPAAPVPPPLAEDAVSLEQAGSEEVYVPPVVQTIKGQVTDFNGDPLFGASVLIDNTTNGTITDIQGYFSIDSPIENPTLRVAYTGFQGQEVFTNGEMFLKVQLSEGVVLNEVAVTKFNSRRKKMSGPFLNPRAVSENLKNTWPTISVCPRLPLMQALRVR